MTEIDGVSAREKAHAVLRRFGWNATSFQVLEPEFGYWFADDEAFVAFVRRGGARIVAGGPVCAEERLEDVVDRFMRESAAEGYRVCFFSVEQRLLDRCSLSFMKMGVQPWWDAVQWRDRPRYHRSLREQLRRARAKGVTTRAIEPEALAAGSPDREAMESVIRRWSAAKPMPPMAFLVDVEPFELPRERLYRGAWRNGELIAFVVAVPVYARSGWFIEDLIRDPSAPNGTMELLIHELLNNLADQRVRFVTMGMAPLAEAEGLLHDAKSLGRGFYNFDGVLSFKRKFAPSGESPVFLAWGPGTSAWLALYDTLHAFVRTGWLSFAWRTLMRGPQPVVSALGWLLIPWAAGLATRKARKYFPSRRVQAAWVLFDLTLATFLIFLGNRWHRKLGSMVRVAVGADAVLTTVQVARYNRRRRWSGGQWLLIAAATAAPVLAFAVLSGASARHGGRI